MNDYPSPILHGQEILTPLESDGVTKQNHSKQGRQNKADFSGSFTVELKSPEIHPCHNPSDNNTSTWTFVCRLTSPELIPLYKEGKLRFVAEFYEGRNPQAVLTKLEQGDYRSSNNNLLECTCQTVLNLDDFKEVVNVRVLLIAIKDFAYDYTHPSKCWGKTFYPVEGQVFAICKLRPYKIKLTSWEKLSEIFCIKKGSEKTKHPWKVDIESEDHLIIVFNNLYHQEISRLAPKSKHVMLALPLGDALMMLVEKYENPDDAKKEYGGRKWFDWIVENLTEEEFEGLFEKTVSGNELATILLNHPTLQIIKTLNSNT